MFVNLVDKKNEQGALGEAFDAALKAVQDGAGIEGAPDEAGAAPGSLSKTTNAGAVPVPVPELGGSLRHVWFDFHHEVCAGVVVRL